MKLSEIKIVLPVQKPRDPNQHVLAAKKNAGGPMRDKKRELEVGKVKHKGKMDEGIEDDQADLMTEFETKLRENASKLSAKQVKEFKARMDAAAKTFLDAYHSHDDEDDEAAENALDHMEQINDELKDAVHSLKEAKKKGAWYVVDGGKKILVGPTDHDDAHKQWMELSDSGKKKTVRIEYIDDERKHLYEGGRPHVYGPGDEQLKDHPNKACAALFKGPIKVHTRSGYAKAVKVQWYNGGSNFKLDREVKLSDGDMSAWVPSNEVKFVQEDLTEGWMNHKDGKGTFTADIAELDAALKDKKQQLRNTDMKCPGCKEKIKFADFKRHADPEGDITEWSLDHDCGAKLKIWNT